MLAVCSKFVLVFLCFGICNGKGNKAYINVTDAQYHQMPVLFHLDDYDECMIYKNPLYCYTEFQFSPKNIENPPEVWNIIQEVISAPRFYRHDRPRHGICLKSTCPKIPIDAYAVGNGTEQLWKGLSECYTEKYDSMGLKAHVENIHCENETPFYQIDYIDIIYAVCVLSLITLVFVSTIYERYAKSKTEDEYQKLTSSTKLRKLICAFSLMRNFERLRKENTTDAGKSLAPIQGIRVYNMGCVIMCHTIMIQLRQPLENPLYNESTTLKVETMFLTNGALIVQTFLLLSGWLMSYNICAVFYGKKLKLKHLWLAFVNRYVRLVPILILTVGFQATWMRHMGRGPVWDHVIGYEYRNCRKNWWLNFLFLNNYVNTPEMCLQQAWYLAVDMHSFIIALFVMMVVINYPQQARKVFIMSIVLPLAIMFVEQYYQEFDILIRGYPEYLYEMQLNLREWTEVYIVSQNSMASYMQGVICGYYFYRRKAEKRETIDILEPKIMKVLWVLFVFVVPISTVLLAGKYYMDGSDPPRWEILSYQVLNRYLFVMPISIGLFGFTFGYGGAMRKVTSWAPLQVIARTTFSIYLTHAFVMRFKASSTRTPIYVHDYDFFTQVLGDITTSIALGTIVCLIIEMPISTIQKIYLSPETVHTKMVNGEKKKKIS